MITIYTDGACSGNPGPGGAATIVEFNEYIRRKETCGYKLTTNNRMELMAVILGFKIVEDNGSSDLIEVISDSKYLCDSVSKGWLKRWVSADWMKNAKESCANIDLWKEIYSFVQTHTVKFVWVRGHQQNALNNECDKIAREAAKNPTLEDEGYGKSF